MSTGTLSIADYHKKTVTNRLGLWLFIMSDAFAHIPHLKNRIDSIFEPEDRAD